MGRLLSCVLLLKQDQRLTGLMAGRPESKEAKKHSSFELSSLQASSKLN